MDDFSEDKRKQNRIKQHSFLRVNENIALLIDISINGMRIAMQEVPASPEVEIKISIESKEFRFPGEVRWFSDKNEFSGLYYIGVFIEKPPGNYEKLITKILG